MNELAIVDPKEFGLEEKQAKTITKGLSQILEEREILSKEYARVVKLEITEENIPIFKALRLQISKNRTKGVETWRKTNKEYWLRGGQFIDAVGRKESSENIRMEDALRSNEEHFDNIEKERLEKLQEDRASKMAKYDPDHTHMDMLGKISESAFEDMLVGAKVRFETKQAEEKKIEDDRIAKEKQAQLLSERECKLLPFSDYFDVNSLKIDTTEEDFNKFMDSAKKSKKESDDRAEKQRLENKRLKEEADEREVKIKAENDERDRITAEMKAESDAILQKEREEKQKIESELRVKKEAEEKAESDRLVVIELELKKGDSAKIKDLISDLETLKSKYEFKSKANQSKYAQVGGLIDKVVNYINR